MNHDTQQRTAVTVATRWPWWHRSNGPDDYRIRELLRAIWDLHALYGPDVWVWRGQADKAHDLTPAAHTRVAPDVTDRRVKNCTEALIRSARSARLDIHEGTRLPDLALLALLQHHGAGTPLFDVSLDPLVGLYMAVVGSPGEDGVLFAIRKPESSIVTFDSRCFSKIYEGLTDQVRFYSAPDVSERLRIQRGHFLVGRVSDRRHATIDLEVESADVLLADTWIHRAMAARGRQGLVRATTNVGVFRVTAKFKEPIREWLEERSGLTPQSVLPVAWHRPHLDAFCRSHGRKNSWLA